MSSPVFLEIITLHTLFICIVSVLRVNACMKQISHDMSYLSFFPTRKRKAEEEAEEVEKKKVEAEWNKNFEVQ